MKDVATSAVIPKGTAYSPIPAVAQALSLWSVSLLLMCIVHRVFLLVGGRAASRDVKTRPGVLFGEIDEIEVDVPLLGETY